MALGTSPLNLIPTQADYRPFKLRCRFTIGTGACHRRISELVPPCEHVARAMFQSGRLFLDDMQRQGWEPIDGDLFLTGGPFPTHRLVTSVPAVPKRPVHGSGTHPRVADGVVAYDSPLSTAATLDTTDGWEYELTGWFLRKMLPTVMTVEAARHVEALRAARRQRRARRGR